MKTTIYTLQEKVNGEWQDYSFSEDSGRLICGSLEFTVGRNFNLLIGKVENKLEDLVKMKGDSFRIVEREVVITEKVIQEFNY